MTTPTIQNPLLSKYNVDHSISIHNGNLTYNVTTADNAHEEDNSYDGEAASANIDNIAMAEWLAHGEDDPYEVVGTLCIDEIKSEEAEQQVSLPVYSQVMTKKSNPSQTAQMRPLSIPSMMHADSVRQEVVYAKPQKAKARSAADTKPGKISFLYLHYITFYM